MKYVVLGGSGIIGTIVVMDLAKTTKDDQIIIVERKLKKAEKYANSFKSTRVKAAQADVSNQKQLAQVCKGADVVLSCVRHDFNLGIMKACIHAKANYVDLGGMFHFTKKELKLDKLFRKNKIVGILGMGAAPGITNLLAAHGGKNLKKVESIEIVFADVDYTKYNQPFILPYSFETLIEEYTMPPAVFRNGRLSFAEPLSGIKKYDFGKEFGKQEGFLTLHSEIATLPSYFRKKGIKKCEFRVTFEEEFNKTMKMLIDLGFGKNEMIRAEKNEINILKASSEIMGRLLPKEGTKIKDKDILRVIINKGKVVMDATTESDGKYAGGTLNTGIPCSIAAQLIANGKIGNYGVHGPESAIDTDLFFKELAKRKIKVFKNHRKIN